MVRRPAIAMARRGAGIRCPKIPRRNRLFVRSHLDQEVKLVAVLYKCEMI